MLTTVFDNDVDNVEKVLTVMLTIMLTTMFDNNVDNVEKMLTEMLTMLTKVLTVMQTMILQDNAKGGRARGENQKCFQKD